MEDILELYQTPYDPQVPMVCMDEQPVQLIKETRKPLPAEPGNPARYDYEYERNGTATIFRFTEPLRGVRTVSVREHKTAIDWATEVKHLLDTQYAEADRLRLVCDNLNTHGLGSLYEAFPPEQARALAARLEVHHTPKHGSWLNIAEIELSALTWQCLDRRMPELRRSERKPNSGSRGAMRPKKAWTGNFLRMMLASNSNASTPKYKADRVLVQPPKKPDLMAWPGPTSVLCLGRNGIVNLYRRAVATYSDSDPTSTNFFEETRIALQQTPPFEGSGDTHLWDGHGAPSGPDLWRKCPCPHRMLLVDAITTALTWHGGYLAGWVDACQKRADHDVPHAIELIGHVLDEFYSRRRKLHRQYAKVVEAVLRIR